MSSCSVKEDRTACPCWLDVFFEDVPSRGLVLAAEGEDLIWEDSVGPTASSSWKEYVVPRGRINLYGANLPGPYMIEYGEEADSLYAFNSTVDCFGEIARDTVRLHKQFATLSIVFLSGGVNTPQYYPVIRGNVCGVKTRSLSLVGGPFRFRPVETSANCFRARIPRQSDESLVMDLMPISGGDVADVVEIGGIIKEAGYDWTAEDLEDISLVIDFARMAITVKILPWVAEYVYDITI